MLRLPSLTKLWDQHIGPAGELIPPARREKHARALELAFWDRLREWVGQYDPRNRTELMPRITREMRKLRAWLSDHHAA